MQTQLTRLKDMIGRIAQQLPKEAWISLGISLTILFGLIATFAQISDVVTDHHTKGFDEAILHSVHTISSPALDVLVSILTEFGGLIGVVTLTLGAVSLFGARRKWKRAAYLAVTVLGASLLNLALKATFQRTRPDLWDHIVTELSYSFPSGHAMASMGLAAGLVLSLWNTRYRRVAVIGSLVYVLVIAFTRLYLGVHFPTDILAGWCASIAWAVLVKIVFDHPTWRSLVRTVKK